MNAAGSLPFASPEEQVLAGRDEQFGKLRSGLEAVLAGRSAVRLIRGVTGSGKSSLVNALVQEAENSEPAALVASVEKDVANKGALLPFQAIVHSFLGADGVVKGRRTKSAIRIAGGAIAATAPEFLSLVFPPAALINTSARHVLEKLEVWDRVKARREQDQTTLRDVDPIAGYTTFFQALAREQPVVVILDDIQWLDQTSVELFTAIAASISEATDVSLLLVGTYRSHEVSADPDHHVHTLVSEVKRRWGDVMIDLDEINAEERARFVSELLDLLPNRLDQSFRSQLFDRTGGNPLHAVELVREMAEAGELVTDDEGRWQTAHAINWDRLPSRVEGALEGRLGKISKGARAVLEAASIQGGGFSAQVVAATTGLPLDTVVACLDEDLGRRHLMVDDHGLSGSEPRLFLFTFSHPEYREHVYGSLGRSRRALLHSKVADALIDLYGSSGSPPPVEIATHLANAGRNFEAAPYLLAAAEEAREVGAASETVSHATDALALLGADADHGLIARVEALAGWGYNRLQEFGQALRHLERALDAANAADNNEIAAWTKADLATIAWRENRFLEASALLADVAEHAVATGDLALESKALRNHGVVARHAGNATAALGYYREAMIKAEQLGDPLQLTPLLNNMGVLYATNLNDQQRAVDFYERAAAVAMDSGNDNGMAVYARSLAEGYRDLGQLRRAERWASEAIARARNLGARRGEGIAQRLLADVFWLAGNLEQAASQYRAAIETFETLGRLASAASFYAGAWIRLAVILLELGDHGQALTEATRRADEVHRQFGPWPFTSEVVLNPDALTLLVGSANSRAQREFTPPRQVVTSGIDTWWQRWTTATSWMVWAAVNRSAEVDREALARTRLATAVHQADGTIASVTRIVNAIEASTRSTSLCASIRSIISDPPVRQGALAAVETDAVRLNALTDQYQTAVRPLSMERYRVPINLREQKQRVLEAIRSGRRYEPLFAFAEVPIDLERPLEELLTEIDPVTSIWDERLYETLEDQIHLIKAFRSRQSTEISNASGDAFGTPSEQTLAEAREVLSEPFDEEIREPSISADSAVGRFRKILEVARLEEWRVEADATMSARMSVRNSERLIRIAAGTTFTEAELQRLVVHEIGTHVMRAENGRRQPLTMLGIGVGRNLATEEGLAAYNEERFGLTDALTMRRYALRALAVDLAARASFFDVFSMVADHAEDLDEAFAITLRTKRGIPNGADHGGYLKDHVYLEGVLRVRSAIRWRPDTYDLLMSVKAPVEMAPLLRELQDEGLLLPPAHMPDQLATTLGVTP